MERGVASLHSRVSCVCNSVYRYIGKAAIARERKTTRGHLMPPQQHLCNGFGLYADYLIFAQE